MTHHREEGLWPATLAIVFCFLLLLPSASMADDEECLECHAMGEDMVELAMEQQVNAELWTASIHADAGMECIDCHEDIGDYPHEATREVVRCINCHDGYMDEVQASVHGESCCSQNPSANPFPEDKTCTPCHGTHDIFSSDDPRSHTNHKNIPSTCGQCHGNLEVIQPAGLTTAAFDNYQQSVHGLSQDNPDMEPAVCTDCHGSHNIARSYIPDSPISHFNINRTCGECHDREFEEHRDSVHGQALLRGVTASPTCTDCHGIHSIKIVPDDTASPQEEHLVRTTCILCHESEKLMEEFDVRQGRVTSYKMSYHGLANHRGNTAVADCASCHGIHAIYPSTDPRSSVAPENLQETCGNCHPGAGEQFANSQVHFMDGEANLESEIVGWVKKIYWILLFGVLGGMALHNIIITAHYLRKKIKQEKSMNARRRFTTSQMLQHATLFTTFFLLVITGFMLAYPDTWWAKLLVQAGVTESIRRWIHRIAAIFMTIASFYHLFWLIFTPYGRAELKRIAPGIRDVREVIQNMSFHLGLSRHQAAFAKFDYPAKAEYWALVWGTIVMVLTGLILWFPVLATSFLPSWSLKVSEVIHLFEAWLATLAILIFHFYYVFFHPEFYPLNLAMFNGKMDKGTAEHHHPSWVDDDEKPTMERTGFPTSPKS